MTLLAGVIVLLQRERKISAGPVEVGGVGTASAQPIDVGVDYSFGYMLWNSGKKPAVVERVRVLGLTGPIEVLDVWARQHPSGPKHNTFTFLFGFPPLSTPRNRWLKKTSYPCREQSAKPVLPTKGSNLSWG